MILGKVGQMAGDPERIAERSKVKWAWSMDPRTAASVGDAALHNALQKSAVKDELLDVVRLLSSKSVEAQTVAPSYTQSLHNIKMESSDHRSIAVQCGERLAQQTTSAQVVEGDITRDSRPRDAFGSGAGEEDPLLSIGAVSSLHSSYLPTCNVPTDLYPVFMSDAAALGICNRYAYVALPKAPVELPPRRQSKVVSPVDFPHLFGRHNPSLDDHTVSQLGRAFNLWSSCSGFVPKH